MSRVISKRKIFSIVLIIFSLAIAFILIQNSRHVWKAFGFLLCEDPNKVIVDSVSNESITNRIVVKGKLDNDKMVYSGYTYVIKDKTMYIGIKYKYICSTLDDKYFEITIPYSTNSVNKVVIRNNSVLRQILPSVDQ